jgi:hypothetical protein
LRVAALLKFLACVSASDVRAEIERRERLRLEENLQRGSDASSEHGKSPRGTKARPLRSRRRS